MCLPKAYVVRAQKQAHHTLRRAQECVCNARAFTRQQGELHRYNDQNAAESARQCVCVYVACYTAIGRKAREGLGERGRARAQRATVCM